MFTTTAAAAVAAVPTTHVWMCICRFACQHMLEAAVYSGSLRVTVMTSALASTLSGHWTLRPKWLSRSQSLLMKTTNSMMSSLKVSGTSSCSSSSSGVQFLTARTCFRHSGGLVWFKLAKTWFKPAQSDPELLKSAYCMNFCSISRLTRKIWYW